MLALLSRRAWRETRVRFALAAGALVVTALADADGGTGPLRSLFCVLVIALAGGSLRQERVLGTLGFTLALPVRRGAVLGARAAVGAAEVAVLAGLVAGIAAVRSPGSAGQALGLAVVWAACGAVVLALALAVSTLVANAALAWLVAVLGLLAYEAAVTLTGLAAYPQLDLFHLMRAGGDRLGLALLGLAAASAALLAVAGVVERRSEP